jgi:hypothetical protein
MESLVRGGGCVVGYLKLCVNLLCSSGLHVFMSSCLSLESACHSNKFDGSLDRIQVWLPFFLLIIDLFAISFECPVSS